MKPPFRREPVDTDGTIGACAKARSTSYVRREAGGARSRALARWIALLLLLLFVVINDVYKTIWIPEIGEKLTTKPARKTERARSIRCRYDEGEVTVGHVPREISKLCCLFMKKGRRLTCTVTGPRRRSTIPVTEGGLEVQCSLSFEGPPELLKKFSKVVNALQLVLFCSVHVQRLYFVRV